MTRPDLKYYSLLSKAMTPHQTVEAMLSLGFNGIIFQRWRDNVVENWEASIPDGFLEQYYGAELDRACPVALALHSWTRDYTFDQARRYFPSDKKVNDLSRKFFESYGIYDGVVLYTGTNFSKSAVIMSSSECVQNKIYHLGGLMALGAHTLTLQLPENHSLLRKISRDNPTLSNMQNRVISSHISHPELSALEIANKLGISVKTLHSHHKKIAQKIGVTSFTGAVVKKLTQPLERRSVK